MLLGSIIVLLLEKHILFDECKFEIYFFNYGTILKNTKKYLFDAV